MLHVFGGSAKNDHGLGEAASRVSATARDAFPALPWAEMTGMRNRLIHGYFSIDKDIVWQTVASELAPLAKSLDEALKQSAST